MRNRVAVIAGALAIGLLITGIAWAAQEQSVGASTASSTQTTSSSSSTSTTQLGTTSTESRESDDDLQATDSALDVADKNEAADTELEAADTEVEAADDETEAADDESEAADDDATESSSTTAGVAIPTGPITYDVDGAGSVTVVFANGTMTLGTISPAAGWTVDESQQSGTEIEVKLTNGDQEAELKVEIEGGQVKVRIERDSKD